MSSSGTRKCYHCKQSGHMAKDCAMAPKKDGSDDSKPSSSSSSSRSAAPAHSSSSSSSNSDSASSGQRKCYHCKQSGHMAKDCPQAPKDGSAAPSRKKESSTDEPSFKERLAAFKEKQGADPEKKISFCYLCGKEGHRERDCDRNSKKKEDKTCLRCGEPDHIARYCPTITNRTVYRQENKDRAKGCYVCAEEGHHAEECPQLEALAEEFSKFLSKIQSGMKLNVKVYNILMEKCAKALELNGALYLYEQMLARGVECNADTMGHLEYLFDRSGKDQSKIKKIPMLPKRVHRLKEIVQAHRHGKKTEDITSSVLGPVVSFLSVAKHREEAEKCNSLFDLAKWLKNQTIPDLNEQFSANSARQALTALKALGRYHQKNKGAEFDLPKKGEDYTTPGKFQKKEDGAAAASASSKKKKKSKSSKKKKEASNADNDVEMKDASASSEKKKKDSKKRKEPSEDSTPAPAADAQESKKQKKEKKEEKPAKSEKVEKAKAATTEKSTTKKSKSK